MSTPSIPTCYDNKCSICLENYDQDNRCLLLPCDHLFHVICSANWIRVKESCPLCRDRIFVPIPTPKLVLRAIHAGKSHLIHEFRNDLKPLFLTALIGSIFFGVGVPLLAQSTDLDSLQCHEGDWSDTLLRVFGLHPQNSLLQGMLKSCSIYTSLSMLPLTWTYISPVIKISASYYQRYQQNLVGAVAFRSK